jgi:O-antigen/teichoic acid export membrane protein
VILRGQSFLSQSAGLTILTGAAAALSAAYAVLTGRWLGPEEYGAAAAVVSLASLLAVCLGPLETGVAKFAAAYHAEGDPGKVATLAGGGLRRLLRALALAALLWLPATWVVSGWLHLPGASPLLWLTAYLAAVVLATVPRGALRGWHRFPAFGANQVAESAVRLAAGGAALALAPRAGSALAGYALGALAGLGLGLWQTRDLRRHPRRRLDAEPLWAFAGPLLLVTFYGAFVTNADVLVARHALPGGEAGLYGASATLARLLHTAAAPALTVLFSRVAGLQAGGRRSRRAVLAWCLPLVAGLASSLALPWWWGEELLRLLFGGQFTGGAPVLRVLWLTACLHLTQSAALYALLAAGRARACWALLLPCALLLVLFWHFHGSAAEVALCCLAAAVAGSAVVAVLLLVAGAGGQRPRGASARSR